MYSRTSIGVLPESGSRLAWHLAAFRRCPTVRPPAWLQPSGTGERQTLGWSASWIPYGANIYSAVTGQHKRRPNTITLTRDTHHTSRHRPICRMKPITVRIEDDDSGTIQTQTTTDPHGRYRGRGRRSEQAFNKLVIQFIATNGLKAFKEIFLRFL